MDEYAEFLVIVDMQNDFTSGSLGSEEARAIVPNVAAFLTKFLEEHGKSRVIFTKDTPDTVTGDPAAVMPSTSEATQSYVRST